jgi:hypothetical protein
MATPNTRPKKKLFTVQEANATLPLVRAVVRDVTALGAALRERHERLQRIRRRPNDHLSEAHREEIDQAEVEFERGRERMTEYERELRQIGVELKDPFMGLVDFPCQMDGRIVYLCWRQGEAEVAHWHELDAGFAGRRRLLVDAPLR